MQHFMDTFVLFLILHHRLKATFTLDHFEIKIEIYHQQKDQNILAYRNSKNLAKTLRKSE